MGLGLEQKHVTCSPLSFLLRAAISSAGGEPESLGPEYRSDAER